MRTVFYNCLSAGSKGSSVIALHRVMARSLLIQSCRSSRWLALLTPGSGDAQVFNVQEHVGRVGVNTKCSSLFEFGFAVTTRKHANSESAASAGCQHVPDCVAHHDTVFHR